MWNGVEQQDVRDDDLLSVLGYKVKSSDMADVAQKIEHLEGVLGNDDGLSHVASDSVHYNPSDLSSWLESMICELNPPFNSLLWMIRSFTIEVPTAIEAYSPIVYRELRTLSARLDAGVVLLTGTAPSPPNSSETPENQSSNFTGKYHDKMGSSNALANLQLNSSNCFNCASSTTNHTNSLQINQKKNYLSVSNKRQNKVNRVVCFALEDIRDMQRKLGIGGRGGIVEDKPKVVDEIKEDTQPENGGAIYNFLYPDKELLPEDKEMSIFDHLEELRERLFISVLAVGAAILGCFVYSKELIMLLEAPVSSQGVRFLQLAPGEFFFTTIKVSGYCGILLGSPVILYEIIAFVLPGLTKSERKFLAPIVLGSSILFYAGIAFSYSVLTPAALNFFVTYAEGVVESLWSIDQYFEFVLVLMFSTGLSFQVPVIQLLLGQVGLVSGDQMLSIWRYVVVGAVIAAAIVTPSTDPLTQLLLAGPLLGLYFGGAWTVKFIGR
ncbi:hypothetical protein L1887_33444 [Cichorium endivia]|nr:hypothetical protein L1887_33444 [Cichorium endivia]